MLNYILGFVTGLTITSNLANAGSNNSEIESSSAIKFICDEKLLTIVSNDDGWALLGRPDVEVFTTYDGFGLYDPIIDAEIWLRRLVSGVNVLDVEDMDGSKQYVCSVLRND